MHSTNVVAFHSFVQLFIHSYIHKYIEETLIKTTCVFERITLHAFHKYLTFLLELRRRDILFFFEHSPHFHRIQLVEVERKKAYVLLGLVFLLLEKYEFLGFIFFFCVFYTILFYNKMVF